MTLADFGYKSIFLPLLFLNSNRYCTSLSKNDDNSLQRHLTNTDALNHVETMHSKGSLLCF